MAVHVHGVREGGAVDEIQNNGAAALDLEHRRTVVAGGGDAGQRPDPLTAAGCRSR